MGGRGGRQDDYLRELSAQEGQQLHRIGAPQGAKMVKKKFGLQCGRPRFNPWIGKIPWRREWPPTLVFLSRKFTEVKDNHSIPMYIL